MSNALNQPPEWVSLLADGQLQGEAFGRAVEHLAASAQAREDWDNYHLVGEVMRHGSLHARGHDAAFVARLRARIDQESAKTIAVSAYPISATGINGDEKRVSNDAQWRRVVGLASVAFAAVLVWQGVQWLAPGNGLGAASQLAGAAPKASGAAVVALQQQPSASAPEAQVMLRDPRLDAMLAAHRQFGGNSALQMPSGFLRNATFQEGGR